MNLAKNKKGFSFLEVMITIVVLAVGILGALALVANSMRYSMNSRDSIIASELAQEGIELTRNVRDNNFFTHSADPFYGIISGASYRISYNDTALSSATPYSLYYNTTSGFYSHSSSSATATKFYRKIDVANYIDANTGRTIKSTVWWNGSSTVPSTCNIANKCIYVQDVLTKW